MNVLVDTPIWSLALRRSRTVLRGTEKKEAFELRELIQEGRSVLIGVVRQEILSGIRDEAMFARLRDHLHSFPDEPLVAEDYEEAARCNNVCRRRGISGSAVDFLLCAAALRRGHAIFTNDADFRRYARFVPIVLHQSR